MLGYEVIDIFYGFYSTIDLDIMADPVIVTGRFVMSPLSLDGRQSCDIKLAQEYLKLIEKQQNLKQETRLYSAAFLDYAFKNADLVSSNLLEIERLRALYHIAWINCNIRQRDFNNTLTATSIPKRQANWWSLSDDVSLQYDPHYRPIYDIYVKAKKELDAINNSPKKIKIITDPNTRQKICEDMPRTDGKIVMSIALAAAFEAIISNPILLDIKAKAESDRSAVVKVDPREVEKFVAKDRATKAVNGILDYYGISSENYKILIDPKRKAEHRKIIDDARTVDRKLQLKEDIALLDKFIQNPQDPSLNLNADLCNFLAQRFKITQASVSRNQNIASAIPSVAPTPSVAASVASLDSKPIMNFFEFSRDRENLSKRSITDLNLLMTILKQYKLKKDGENLPSPELVLRRAAATGNMETIKMLIKLVEDLNLEEKGTESGKTALDLAIQYGKAKVIEFLVDMKDLPPLKNAAMFVSS